MEYFLGLVKKEFIEIRGSWKQLFLYGLGFVAFAFLVHETNNAPTSFNPLGARSFSNPYYALIIFYSSLMPSNFLMESIFSDKRNQTFERYFVSGNVKTIMLAKLSAMSILGIIPFIVFSIYAIFNGVKIIDNIFMAINIPFYFWINLGIVTIVCFLFNDEKSMGFAAVPFILLMMGLLYLNDFLAEELFPQITVILTIICAAIVTFIAYRFYKKTKIFLKI